MVYRRTPLEALCVKCAEADPQVTWKPSIAWEKARTRQRRARTRATQRHKVEHRDRLDNGDGEREVRERDRPTPVCAILGPLDEDGDW
jgi:hypothetical protein